MTGFPRRLSEVPPRVWILLGLVALTFGIYGQTAWHPFIILDDDKLVYGNPHVRSGLTWENILWAFTSTSGESFWHPLTWLSHMLDVELFGTNAGGHHLMSAGIHALNALVLFLVLARMTGFPWRSAFVAALFAVHPLHVESVAWVAERKDVLSTLFFLLSLWAYTRYAERPGKGRYGMVALCFSLSLMSKPMGVTLPFVLLLLDYWPLGRIAGLVPDGNVATRKGPSTPTSRVLWEKVPLLLMAAGSAAMTLRYGGGTNWIGSLGEFPLWVRAANAVVSYSAYIWKTVWPLKLAVYYPHPGGDIPMWKVAAGSLFLVGVTFIAVRFGKRRPYFPVGWFFYIGTLVPVIGLVQVGEQAMADRYTYLPLIGVFLMMVWGAAETVRKTCAVLPLIIMATLILLALATVARHQTLYWSNSIRLLRHTLDAAPEKNWVAHFSLGYELDELGRKEEAITEYERALAIQPKSADLHNNLGLILKEKGKYEEAAAHFLDAANLRRNHFDSRYNLAETFFQQSRFHEAVPWYQDALRIRPDDLDAHNRLGISLAKLGKIDEAIVHFQEMLRLSPGDARALKNIGIALEKRRRGNP